MKIFLEKIINPTGFAAFGFTLNSNKKKKNIFPQKMNFEYCLVMGVRESSSTFLHGHF